MPHEQRRWVFFLAGLGAVYALLVLPLAFFRHDDWWILGNSVRHLPGDWGFLFRPTLFHSGREITWFFRPGFKFLVYLFYQAFGFHYALWMGTLGVLYLGTVYLGAATVLRLTGQARNGLWFVVAAGCSVAIHFGSLVWMGEGMMNVPQAFLLMVCTYAFVLGKQSAAWRAASVAAFVLALAFKESTVFHFAVLAAMVIAEPWFQKPRGLRKFYPLIPFACVSAVYLVFRLGVLPITPSYMPEYTWAKVTRSIAIGTAPIFLPLALWVVLLRFTERKTFQKYLIGLGSRIYYMPFLAVSLAIYAGHDFFSPGWYLVFGTFTVFCFALAPMPAIKARRVWQFGAALFVFSVVPLAVRLDSVGWWGWKKAQVAAFEAISHAAPDTTDLWVRDCRPEMDSATDFARIVANDEGLRQMWFLTHGTDVHVTTLYCTSPAPQPRGPRMEFVWVFPETQRSIASR